MIAVVRSLWRLRRKILFGAVICLAAFALIGFFAVPPLLRSVLSKQLTAALHRQVTIREVRVNPFALSATVRGLTIAEPAGPEKFVSVEELYVNLEASSLLRRGVVIRELRVAKPFVRLVRKSDQTYSISDLLPAEQSAPKPSTPSRPLRFSVSNISVVNGGADLVDEAAQRSHSVRDLNITVPFLSNIPSYVETFVQPGLSVTINGTRYALQGKTKPFAQSQETSLELKVADLDLPYYLAYVPPELLTFRLPSAKLDTQLAFTFIHKGSDQRLTVQGDVALRQLAVDDRQGNPILRLPRLSVALAEAEPLTRRAHVSKVALDAPELTVVREKGGAINLESLVPRPAEQPHSASTPSAPAAPTALPAVDVDEILLSGGTVRFSDLATHLPFKTILAPLDVRISGLSTRAETKGSYQVTVATEAKETIQLEGGVAVTPLLVEGKVEVKSVPLKKYAPYYSDSVLFDIREGTVSLGSGYRVGLQKDALSLQLEGLAVSLAGLRLRERGAQQDVLSLPRFAVARTAVDLSKRDAIVGEIATGGALIKVSRSRQGEINLLRLVPPTEPAVAAPQSRKEGAPAAPPSAGSATPWRVKVGSLNVAGYRVEVRDEVPAEPVALVIDELSVRARDLSTAQNAPRGKLAVALRLNGNPATVDGSVSLAPIRTDLQVTAQALDLRPFQSYASEKVKVTLTSGQLSTAGKLQVEVAEPAGLQAKYAGELTIGKFAALDRSAAEEVLRWDSLALHELTVSVNPLVVRARKVALADFFARLSVQPNGRLNLQDILAAPTPESPAPPGQAAAAAPSASPQPAVADDHPAAGSPSDIQIEEITLQGGHIQFLDRSLKPNYSATLTEIGGRVSGLSSAEASRADLELRGKLENAAPLEIVGQVNPLKRDLFADIRARFTGMDLSPTTPYAAKYAGYTIEKGKLSFDLQYHIDKRALDSQNKVFVDQFTFGEKVESPTATSLPVKFAVALLKDRNGEIHLDIPVTGSLDDPKFSIWRIVWQVIGNLITKAVTSPFALLGSLVGGGESMQYVEFEPGLIVVSDAGAKKLDQLASALAEKPGLKLDITGHVDPEADREGLKQYLLQRKVKAQKLLALSKQGATAMPVDDMPIEADEYEKYLTLAYRAETFPKPRNAIGIVRALPVPEMEKLILTHTEVGEEELRRLAADRANAVKQALLKSGKLDAERLFIVEPKALLPEKKENVKSSRVEFKIG